MLISRFLDSSGWKLAQNERKVAVFSLEAIRRILPFEIARVNVSLKLKVNFDLV